MKQKIKRWGLLLGAILILAGIGGAIYMIGSHYVSIRGQKLDRYTYSVGGGMTGGYYRETVKRLDDTHALIRVEEAEWHNQDPEIREYRADAAVLQELENIIRKHRMNFWNQKRFSRMFIADGESQSYQFSFGQSYISFSSQHYPVNYSGKLEKLKETVKKYMDTAEILPSPASSDGAE